MDTKDSFNDSARKADTALKERVKELLKERNRQLDSLEKEQALRKDSDMEKAKQRVLREHNRLDYKPSYARRKALTSEQLEKRASDLVKAQNLREANSIKERCRRKIESIKRAVGRSEGELLVERECSHHKIKSIFNNIPKDRDDHELER